MTRMDKKMTDDSVIHRIMVLLRKRKKMERELLGFLGISSVGMPKWSMMEVMSI